MKPVLVVEMPASTTHEMADDAKRRITAAVNGEYHVIMTTDGVRVYEVGRWLWERALRRVGRPV